MKSIKVDSKDFAKMKMYAHKKMCDIYGENWDVVLDEDEKLEAIKNILKISISYVESNEKYIK